MYWTVVPNSVKKGGPILTKSDSSTRSTIIQKLKKIYKTPNHTKPLALLANISLLKEFVKQLHFSFHYLYLFQWKSLLSVHKPFDSIFVYINRIWTIILVLTNLLLCFVYLGNM